MPKWHANKILPLNSPSLCRCECGNSYLSFDKCNCSTGCHLPPFLYSFCFNISSSINPIFFLFFFNLGNIFDPKLLLPVLLVYFRCPSHRHNSDGHMPFPFTSFQCRILKYPLELRSFQRSVCTKLAFGIYWSISTNPTDKCWFSICFLPYIKRMSSFSFFQSESWYQRLYFML